jgi:hypothetical protein
MYQKKGYRSSKTADIVAARQRKQQERQQKKAGTPARARMPASETAAARIPRKSATERTPVSVLYD